MKISIFECSVIQTREYWPIRARIAYKLFYNKWPYRVCWRTLFASLRTLFSLCWWNSSKSAAGRTTAWSWVPRGVWTSESTPDWASAAATNHEDSTHSPFYSHRPIQTPTWKKKREQKKILKDKAEKFLELAKKANYCCHVLRDIKPLFQSSQKLVRSWLRVLASN